MEKAIAVFLVNRLEKTKAISADQHDLCVYGLELLLSFLFGIILIVISGVVFGVLTEALVFLAIFILVRKSTGGLHADTYFKCKCYTVITFLCVMAVSVHVPVPLAVYYLLMPLCIIIVAIAAPVENSHKPLDNDQKKRNKGIALLLYIMISGIGFIIRTYAIRYAYVIFNTLFAIIILMIVPLLERRFSHEARIR